MTDILILNGIVITMDPQRRKIEDGAIAIEGDRIVDVGTAQDLKRRHTARKTIDAGGKVVMPGLFDGHGHAGHGLVKSMGMGRPDLWYEACETIYSSGSTEAFWRADALLTSLERLRFGVTCGVTFFGGGDSVMRTDDPVYGRRHCEAVSEVGIREFLAVGPRRPPFPRRYSQWSGTSRRDVLVTFEDQLRASEALIQQWHEGANGRIHLCMMLPTHHPERKQLSRTQREDLLARTRATRKLAEDYGLLFTQDGHTRGTVKFAHEELGILGPDTLLSHATDLLPEEIDICRKTDTRVVHNPSAIASMVGRCPVPELLDAGVTVMLGSDGTAPDRSYDMFRHMFQCMRYHRAYYHDPAYMPAGKVLEMVTVDAARALGLDRELGSLEKGKKADLVLVDMRRPHLYPLNMPEHRIAYFANGNDVDTVIVDGRVLMEGGLVTCVDEGEILELAQEATEEMLAATQLQGLLKVPHGFWGHSRYPPTQG
ncbi:MAG: amidohydrolase family protein [Chloroflexota bacterium]